MFSKQVDDEVRTAPQKSNPKKKCDDLLNVSLRLTRNVKDVGSSPIKGPRCFLEQDTLPLLLSTGWFQEQIRAGYYNRTKIN